MSNEKTIIGNVDILRLNNEESNRLTIECLQTALFILMEKKPFEQITITEIVKKAGVSRTAFYRNYHIKEDILDGLLTETVDEIYSLMETNELKKNDYEYWLTMFNSLEKYKKALHILFNAQFYERIERGIRKRMMQDFTIVDDTTRYVIRFWSGAVCSVLQEWIFHDYYTSPEIMAERLSNAY